MPVFYKIDLLPYLDFNARETVDNIRQVHPDMPVFELSAKTGQGLDPWIDWLESMVNSKI